MPSSISNILSTLNESGFHKPHLYKVSFKLPDSLPDLRSWQNIASRMEARVNTSLIPAEELRTYERPSYSRGVQRVVSGRSENEPIQMSIIASADLRERRLFEKWMNHITDQHTNMTKFFDEYIGKVFIDIFSIEENSDQAYASNGRTVARYFLLDVFPSGLGEVELSYDSVDTYTTFTVTLTYNRWDRVDYVIRN